MTKFTLTAIALATGLTLGTNAMACSTVVVGKNALLDLYDAYTVHFSKPRFL